MKINKIIIFITIIFIYNLSFASAKDCDKYDKLSKDYAKCTSEILKEKTLKKKGELEIFTSKKINEGKKKINNLKLKEKLLKFKNSKTLKEFVEK